MKKSLLILALAAALTACHTPSSTSSVNLPTNVVQQHATYTVSEGYIGADKGIYGKLYRPQNQQGKQPIIVFAHALGADSTMFEPMANALAQKGIASYLIDFKGGGRKSKSKGDVSEMTVLTETDDLKVALNEVKQWDFVDNSKIVLLGASQGAVVASLVAAEMPNEIAGLISFFPGYIIPDMAKQTYPDPSKIPEKTDFMNGLMDLGRNYYLTAQQLKPYDKIGNFKKPVLLIHGDKDPVVPMSYSEKAHKTYQNSQYFVIKNMAHSFNKEPFFEQSMAYIETYLKQNGFLK